MHDATLKIKSWHIQWLCTLWDLTSLTFLIML